MDMFLRWFISQRGLNTDKNWLHLVVNSSDFKVKQKVELCDNLRFLLSSIENEEDPETIAECFERSNELRSYYLAIKKPTNITLILSSNTKEHLMIFFVFS